LLLLLSAGIPVGLQAARSAAFPGQLRNLGRVFIPFAPHAFLAALAVLALGAQRAVVEPLAHLAVAFAVAVGDARLHLPVGKPLLRDAALASADVLHLR